MTDNIKDIEFMRAALDEAKKAYALGEVPVGAVVVYNGNIVATGYNKREKNKMATAHAELMAIEDACRTLGGWRLSGCTLYVTLEPCPMCAGAIVNSRLDRVVYGVKDSAAGCVGSVINFNAYPFNHAFEVTSGVLAEECREILQEFFSLQRQKKRDGKGNEK